VKKLFILFVIFYSGIMHAMAGDVPQPPADEFDPYEYLDRYKRSDATGNPDPF